MGTRSCIRNMMASTPAITKTTKSNQGTPTYGMSAGLVPPTASSCSASSSSAIWSADPEEPGDGLVLRDHDRTDDHDSHAGKRVSAKQQQAAHKEHTRGDKAPNDVGGNPIDDLREQTCVAAASGDLCGRGCDHFSQCKRQHRAVVTRPDQDAQRSKVLCD